METVRISLGHGVFTVIDAADFHLVGHCRWSLKLCKEGNRYAMGRPYGGRQKVGMHRYLLGLKVGDGLESDHIDGDGLNNRRSNLRVATRTQNGRNIRTRSAAKGVFPCKSRLRPWFARIKINQKPVYLGCFATREEAAMCYNVAAKKYFGEFACLNRVEMG